MRNQLPEFADAVLDTLMTHIAVLDADGVIIGVNEPWRRFADCNSNSGLHPDHYIGCNYLEICEKAFRSTHDASLPPLAEALREVLRRERASFSMEYPCHSPGKERWFIVRITSCVRRGVSRAVVAHEDITARKQAEIALVRADAELRQAQAALERVNAELLQALERERQAARTDELTGLHNRRHFFTVAKALLDVAQRYDKPLCLAVLDLDHFKRFNDLHGHQAGDEALRHVARVASGQLRRSDVLARYGGEEFIVLLPETDVGTGTAQVERVLREIAAIPIELPGGSTAVTGSAGITGLQSPADTLDAMIHRADLALYAAKAAGRNRVLAG